MENKQPLILISNDDGYHAKGIRTLAEMLTDMGRVLVCAPESARSGFSCAFSAVTPLRLKRRHNMGDTEVWSCNGTPVDCVKLAIDQLCGGQKPDIVIGGINHGDNSSVNNHYSGTVGIAMEGCMKYIPAVAFSSCDYNEDANLSPLRPYIRQIVRKILKNGLPKGICLNVNFPTGDRFLGVRSCRMAFGRWTNEVVKQHHPRGYDYYWMIGKYLNDEPEATDTDQWAVSHGYVAITPTLMDVTAHDYMKVIDSWNLSPSPETNPD